MMKYKSIVIPIILIGILFANNSVNAQNTYAVLVGISDYYKNNDLPKSVKDLEKFEEFLMSENGNKTPDSNIVFIKNKDATKQNIIKQSKDLFSKAKPNDRVFFYFTGHGSNGFFCAYDSIPKDEYLYFSEVKDIFKSAKCNTKILFAESCHSGSLMTNATKEEKQIINKEIANLKKDTITNIAIMLSSKDDELSWNGIFTSALNLGLRGNADKNGDKIVSIEELYYFVREKTLKDAAKIGKVQTPILFGNFNLDLVVGGNYNNNPLYYKIDNNKVSRFFYLIK